MTSRMPVHRPLELDGQTVLVIGGSAGIGLATARRALAEGARVIVTARNAQRLAEAATAVGALKTAAFDASDPDELKRFFEELEGPVDHVMVTAGAPVYGPVLQMSHTEALEAISAHALLAVDVARYARDRIRPGGTILLMGGTGARSVSSGAGILTVIAATIQSLTGVLAVEMAPVRVNLIAAGFVDTPLSAALLGTGLEVRRQQLQARLPIGRVVTAEDVAALAVHVMSNTAITGAIYDLDGGQQLVP
jgi:NAD(P)-dependent dehydrogenase (short-subunit alcohol dehydrogenase family)